MSAGAVVVIVFAMFFTTVLIGLGMLIHAFKQQDKKDEPEIEILHNPQLETAETIPMRINNP